MFMSIQYKDHKVFTPNIPELAGPQALQALNPHRSNRPLCRRRGFKGCNANAAFAGRRRRLRAAQTSILPGGYFFESSPPGS